MMIARRESNWASKRSMFTNDRGLEGCNQIVCYDDLIGLESGFLMVTIYDTKTVNNHVCYWRTSVEQVRLFDSSSRSSTLCHSIRNFLTILTTPSAITRLPNLYSIASLHRTTRYISLIAKSGLHMYSTAFPCCRFCGCVHAHKTSMASCQLSATGLYHATATYNTKSSIGWER